MTDDHPDADFQIWMSRLEESYSTRDEELRNTHGRSLPFQDAMFDRWERARKLGFGQGASIYNSAMVYGDVKVGADTWIGPYVILEGSGGGLTIGSTCSVSAGVHIYTHDTIHWALSGGTRPPRRGPVTVGNRCYIGGQTVISAGVQIGDCCVIAANSFVNRNVPSFQIVGGTPARSLGVVRFNGDEPMLDLAKATR